MADPRDLRIQDFTYELPDERIARHPLAERDAAKLLLYRDGDITEDVFRNLATHLPPESLLVFNQTKVVHARLLFQKPTGGKIEIFCLNPDSRYPDITTALAQQGRVSWQCIVGGAAKWKEGMSLYSEVEGLRIVASATERGRDAWTIEFSWEDDKTFSEVLHIAGKVPLPPYLNREVDEGDEARYQTVFAKEEGSVAAPTASLHFTEQVLQDLGEKGIRKTMVTLHVGAGTFLPVKSETMAGHSMHSEWIEVERGTVEDLLYAEDNPIVAAGTTALRTIESLYWIGCKVKGRPELEDLAIDQWIAYEAEQHITKQEALTALLNWMDRKGVKRVVTKTGILIAPGYRFRIARGLITNFHQPQSTLLLLVSAFIGDDWRNIYEYALEHHFRFLSYGDGSLLWRKD